MPLKEKISLGTFPLPFPIWSKRLVHKPTLCQLEGIWGRRQHGEGRN